MPFPGGRHQSHHRQRREGVHSGGKPADHHAHPQRPLLQVQDHLQRHQDHHQRRAGTISRSLL